MTDRGSGGILGVSSIYLHPQPENRSDLRVLRVNWLVSQLEGKKRLVLVRRPETKRPVIISKVSKEKSRGRGTFGRHLGSIF